MEEKKWNQETQQAENAEQETAERARTEKGQPRQHGFLHELWEWVKVLVIAALCAYCINSFIIANSSIPTGSMQETIMAGDRVFGLRLEYTFGEVERNDVAIFLYGYTCRECKATYRETAEAVCPNCGAADKKNKEIYYVKRVIGMPGDHIEIKQTGEASVEEFTQMNIQSASGKVPTGTLYVNGEAVEELYLPEPMLVDGNMFPEVDVVVPEGCYYMLGDNRNNSADARFWGENNFVARDRMIAKVYLKYWPLSDIGLVK